MTAVLMLLSVGRVVYRHLVRIFARIPPGIGAARHRFGDRSDGRVDAGSLACPSPQTYGAVPACDWPSARPSHGTGLADYP